jgi:anti-sigma regulatory factor (Ser/Thr protein kinase)
MKESGRGIFLIREMVDRVRFRSTREGTTVEMTIDLRRLNL